MSFAARAKAGRENAGGFVFPPFEGWTKLKSWKFGLSKSKNPMFTLELKIIEPGQLKGKLIKERVVISAAADWQFDRFLAYLEDSGVDLSTINEKDESYQDIQDYLDRLEDAGQKIRLILTPQEEDKRYYRLKFLEVQKIEFEDAPGPVTEDPDDDEPGQVGGPVAEDPDDDEVPPPPPPPPAPLARRAAAAAPVATKPAATPTAAAAAPVAGARTMPWQKKPPVATAG